MNEAELHVLKSRMYQGKLNKARRGELFGHPPIGYVRLAGGEWAIDPDEQVQAVVRLIFDRFDREASLHGLNRYLMHHRVRIPVRVAGARTRGGCNDGRRTGRRCGTGCGTGATPGPTGSGTARPTHPISNSGGQAPSS